MTINIFTISLDSSPWIGAQFAELTRLRDIDWHWSIVEGAAMPIKDTRWMAGQQAKVSHDCTHQFLQALKTHPRITVQSKASWDGKLEMINAALTAFKEDGILLQMDSDELWSAQQLRNLRVMFSQTAINTAQFAMDYMLGPNVVSTSVDGYGNRSNEWIRAWRYTKGLWMECHEPPMFNSNVGPVATKAETEIEIGKILHMAWVTPQQVAQKQRIYGKKYTEAEEKWHGLQNATQWPVDDLEQWLPWVGKGGSCNRLFAD